MANKRTMALWDKLEALVAEAGGSIDYECECVDAPFGYRWGANDEHCLVLCVDPDYGQTEAQREQRALRDLIERVEMERDPVTKTFLWEFPCDGVDCEYGCLDGRSE